MVASIDAALARGVHVAINYLNCPGFTDTPEERGALLGFLSAHRVHMIQWRNLNFDPVRYLQLMNTVTITIHPWACGICWMRSDNPFRSCDTVISIPPRRTLSVIVAEPAAEVKRGTRTLCKRLPAGIENGTIGTKCDVSF